MRLSQLPEFRKAIMEGAKGNCPAIMMADAGWHGKLTGLFFKVFRQVQEC